MESATADRDGFRPLRLAFSRMKITGAESSVRMLSRNPREGIFLFGKRCPPSEDGNYIFSFSADRRRNGVGLAENTKTKGKQMKKTAKKILCMLLALAVLASTAVSMSKITAFAENGDEISYVVSIEGETLGQGFYVEPTVYTLSRINELIAGEGYGPFTEDDITAAMITLAMIIDNDLEIEHTGNWDNSFYMSSIKGIDKGEIDIPPIIGENGGATNENNDGNDDDKLGEFDYDSMSGWMITVNHHMIGVGCSGYNKTEAEAEGSTFGNGSVLRWQFTVHGYGLDLGVDNGWGMGGPYYTAANKCALYAKYAELKADGFFDKHPDSRNAALEVMENLTATQEEVDEALSALTNAAEKGENPEKTDCSAVLNATMAQLAADITEPSFGTMAGEWTVMALARGGFYEKSDKYFTDYYSRIEEYVNKQAQSVNLGGALHKIKSTENSRLILALSSIGRDARRVGNWNLVEAYSVNGFDWIKKQGINGPVFALIALDSNNYRTSDGTIREKCIEYILSKELSGGGWALSGTVADPDMTAMALQSLAPYTADEKVEAACDRAFEVLSALQKDNGGYASWGSVNSESIAQVIVACTAHGIDPATDSRFVKNGKSTVDALLGFYVEDGRGFAHTLDNGAAANAMATDQACYALAAYIRFISNQNRLYDMTDAFDAVDGLKVSLAVPESVQGKTGASFNAIVGINTWDNNAGYKLLDAVINIPDGVDVTAVTPSKRLSGGELQWNLDLSSGKLRIVYFDAQGLSDIVIADGEFPAELFTVSVKLTKTFAPDTSLKFAVGGLSVKLSSDSFDEAAMIVADTSEATSAVILTEEIKFSALCMFAGDGVDIIGTDKKAMAVFVSGIKNSPKLTFNGDTELFFSEELTEKSGVACYVALVDTSVPDSDFANADKYTIDEKTQASTVTFGDVNGDNIINAQDALNIVNVWLRKTTLDGSKAIIAANVNSDSRINTFDALGISEVFVNGTEFAVILKTVNAVNK